MARPATAAVRLLTGEREPVRLCATSNIDVDAGGLVTVDGVQTEVGDRILLIAQTDGSENGIRTASAGQWYRAADARTSRTMQKGTTAHVQEGSVNAGKTFVFATDHPVIGDTDIEINFYLSDDVLGDVNDAITDGIAAVNAAVSAAGIPASPVANTLLRRNADNTIYEAKTIAEISAELVNLQTGTGAVSRTIQNKFKEQLSVKDFDAVGDGVTNDTAAILAAETARAAVGGDLIFPTGDYLTNGTAVNRANGGGWRGIGNVRLLAAANSAVLIDASGAVVSTALSKVFYVEGIEFHYNNKTSVTGYREAASYLTRISRCKFNRLQYSAIFTGSGAAAQTGWITISDIDQIGEGSWLFRSFDDTHYIINININNFNQQGTGSAPWTGVNALFHFSRAVSAYLNNVNAASLDGAARGVYMLGDCQGIFLNNVIIGWPTYGVHAIQGTDTLIPSYVYINNCGTDQPTVTGFDITGRTWRITNSNSTNGYLRSSTGPAVNIQATATDIIIKEFLAAYMNHDGIKVNVGAQKVVIAGMTAENNNQNAGGNFEINLTSCLRKDVILEGRNYIGAAGVNATGQRVVNGKSSDAVSVNVTPASTTAVTTAEDLMTYSIPAASLAVGRRVRVKAWGATAANANTKTGRLFFGSANLGGWTGTLNASGWKVDAEVVVTGAATQSYVRGSLATLTSSIQMASGTATEAISGAIAVKFQGQNGTASAGDITCNGLEVEILD